MSTESKGRLKLAAREPMGLGQYARYQLTPLKEVLNEDGHCVGLRS